MSSGRARLPLLCFALSGFSALVYQTAWTREFAFVFGTSELAVATVLAAYMGGLAVGAALAARLVAIVRRPLFSYGVLELGIGASALAVPHALRLATPLYVGIFGRAQIPENVGLASGLFYAGCAFVILGVPTALMGATLPLLARDAVQGDAELGSRVGRLYAVNTFGAVAGTVSTAFVLLPRIGLRATVAVAVALNGLIFALMAFAGRGSEAPRPARAAPGQRSPGRAILPLMLVSGAVSFTLEVLWTRLLEHVLGASVYAFATMLASFLVGIALGSAVAARFATRPERAVAGFAMAQLGTACLSLAAFVAVDRLPELARAMALAGGRRGVADPLVAGLTLLPSTLCIGATFPFAVRILARGEHDAGPASARVYAWNTVGAVLGALSAGFVLISALGLEGTLHAAVLASAALALAATLLVAPRRPVLAAIAGALLLAVAAIRPGLPWRLLRTSPLSLVPGWGPIEYYGSGRSATVLLMRQAGEWRLTTNGLPEAGIPAPGQPDALYRTERWLTALPLLARPDAQSMLVIGLGGGVAVEDVPRSVRVIEVAELEPDVVQANRSIASLRSRDPLADPRLRLLSNDARGALLLARDRFDVIVSQPSHPWTAAASHLYTREFFELARHRLASGGVLLQWIGPAFVDEPLLRILVGTLDAVFGHVRVYEPGFAGGILLLASDAPLDVEQRVPEALAASPASYAALGIRRPEDLAACLMLDEQAARRFGADAPRNTDDRNYLQMRSEPLQRRRFRLGDLVAERALDDAPPAGLDRVLVLRRLVELGFRERASRRAAASQDPLERDLGRGFVAEAGQQPTVALAAYRRVLQRDPSSPEARGGVVRLLGAAAGEPGALPPVAGRDEERAVLGALRSGLDGARALDGALGAVAPWDPLYAPAARLRAAWRIGSADPGRAREAVAILDGLDARAQADASDAIARGRAGAAAGEPVVVLASLDRWLGLPKRRAAAAAGRAEARRLLQATPVPALWRAWRDDLAKKLGGPGHGTR